MRTASRFPRPPRPAKFAPHCVAAALLCAALVAAAGRAVPAQALPVDLELVLAIDTSTSVDADEFALQREGLAEAFMHPDVVGAIRAAGEDGVAVTVVQWSGPYRQRSVVGWTLVRDASEAAEFAARVRAAPRRVRGMTDIGGAIRFSVAAIEGNEFEGRRRVIDISGDGTSDSGSSGAERDRAVARGITINGLVIFNEDIDLGALANFELEDHYAGYVVGGAGAFLMKADDFVDFRIAIRRKLVREIAGPATARRAAPDELGP